MRYFRVQWQDKTGDIKLSDPLTTWLDAAKYRSTLIIDGMVPAPCYVTILEY